MLAQFALGVIMERYPTPDARRRFAYLFADENLLDAKTVKWSLLTELYRIRMQRGEAAFWEAVEWTLRHEPKVKDAISLLRTWRLTGKLPSEKPDPDATARTILDLLDPYPDHEAHQILSRLLLAYSPEEDRD